MASVTVRRPKTAFRRARPWFLGSAAALGTLGAFGPNAVLHAQPGLDLPAAARGPTVVLVVRSPERLLQAVEQSGPEAEIFVGALARIKGWVPGLDLKRAVGGRLEFDEEESMFYGVAVPTTDPAALIERLGEQVRLGKADRNGVREFAGGALQARDGHVFAATDAGRLKPLKDALSLLPAGAPEADVFFSVRPKTIPGFFRRSMLDGMEQATKVREKFEQVADDLNPPDEETRKRREAEKAAEVGRRFGERLAQEFFRELLMDTDEWGAVLKFTDGIWEGVQVHRPIPTSKLGRELNAETHAPSRFAAWERMPAPFSIRESCRGSKGPWTKALLDLCDIQRKRLAEASVDPDRDVLPREDVTAFMKWLIASLESGHRDWGAVARADGKRWTLCAGMADPALGQVGPHLRNMLRAAVKKEGPKVAELEENAWREGEFEVDVLTPHFNYESDRKMFGSIFGETMRIAFAFGPDRILIAVGEDCRPLVKRAVADTARPQPTEVALRVAADPAAVARILLPATEADPNRAEFVVQLKAALHALTRQPEPCEFTSTVEGGVRRSRARVGANVCRLLALLPAAGPSSSAETTNIAPPRRPDEQ